MDQIEDLPWREVERILAEYGDEEHIARRIKAWREERGWTLKHLGGLVHLSPSSIYKIENPAAAGGKRRSLSVSEAMAFAKAFEKPLAEILLPEGALLELEAWRGLTAAAEALNEARHQWAIYRDGIERVRADAETNPNLARRIRDYLSSAEQARREQIAPGWVNDADDERGSKIRERMLTESPGRLPKDADSQYPPTPAIVAARTALSGDTIPATLLALLGKDA